MDHQDHAIVIAGEFRTPYDQTVQPCQAGQAYVSHNRKDARSFESRQSPQTGESVVVPDGKSALAAAKVHRPRVILVDFMLPDVRGDVLTRRLRESADLESAFVILMSVADLQEVIHLQSRPEIDLVMPMPFDLERLQIAVETALGRRHPGAGA